MDLDIELAKFLSEIEAATHYDVDPASDEKKSPLFDLDCQPSTTNFIYSLPSSKYCNGTISPREQMTRIYLPNNFHTIMAVRKIDLAVLLIDEHGLLLHCPTFTSYNQYYIKPFDGVNLKAKSIQGTSDAILVMAYDSLKQRRVLYGGGKGDSFGIKTNLKSGGCQVVFDPVEEVDENCELTHFGISEKISYCVTNKRDIRIVGKMGGLGYVTILVYKILM